MSVQFECLSYLKTLIDNIDWVITSSNSKIYFKYDGYDATELTLTTGNYTTTQLIAHITDVLDTGFTISSTVTYSSNKFTIEVEEEHTIQYINENSTAELGFTEDSEDAQSITSDTSISVHFQYVDYLTEENINKIGKRFPCILIQDGDEGWDEAGNSRYDVSHTVILWLYDQINQDRIEVLLENQSIITDTIMGYNTLGNNAICTKVINVEKGNYYHGEINYTEPGYNDNYSVRKITLNVWERVS